MTAKIFQIVATHFPTEFSEYGITKIEEKECLTLPFKFHYSKYVPIAVREKIIQFIEDVQKAESQKDKAFKIKTQIQNFGEFELCYETSFNSLGEELFTEVKFTNSFFIRPCDIIEVRVEIGRIFEKYAVEIDEL